MPGILYHLAFAEEVYKNLSSRIPIDKVNFMSGNLIPDLAIDKQNSHYRVKGSVEGFLVPDMEIVKKALFFPEDSLKLGMYCHLYLDYYFIEDFLIPEFIWDVKNSKVINPRNQKKWDIKTFFSHSGLYGAYTQINQLMVSDKHVSMQTVNEIPEQLPATGISFFDARREKSWLVELNEYLSQKVPYTGEVLNYFRLWNSIEKITNQFASELAKM